MHPEFLFFFNQCESDLRAYIGALVRDPHAREDIFQEVCRTLWEKFDNFEMGQSFGAWARGIATNKMLEARRKSARFPLLFAPEAVEAIQEAFDSEEEISADQELALKLCLESLPEKSRQILTWRYESRLKCDRIANQLGMKTKAIHQVLCRLRQALEQCIQRRLDSDDLEPSTAAETVTQPHLTISPTLVP
jgi:RNA polymerase sigma-70 factor (ECF subfamily)